MVILPVRNRWLALAIGCVLLAVMAWLQFHRTDDAREMGRALEKGPTAEAAASANASPSIDEHTATLGAEQAEALRHRVFSIPTRQIRVNFPDGDAVTVTIRRAPPLRSLEHDVVVDETDPASAFAMYRRAETCLLRLREGRADLSCRESAERHAQQKERWLQMAAEGNDVHALRILAASAIHSKDAIDVLERAWRVGLISPLGRMSDLYFRSAEVPLGQQPSNRVLGLAHLWLQAHLQDIAAGEGRRSYVAQLYENLEARQFEMKPEEIEEAYQVAKEMLKQNRNCCLGP